MNLKELSKLYNEMNSYRPLDPEEVKLLERKIKIDHVYSSNAIEGSTLSRGETEAIINTGMTIHGESIGDILVAVDLTEAYDYMMDLARRKQSLTQTLIRDLNRLSLAKSHPSWAGEYRNIEVRPAGVEINPYAEPFDIRPKMDELIEWANKAQKELHPVQYAADLHLKFVTIHPFRDGNGRTARLLMNLALTEAGYLIININPDKESRNKYMQALNDSNQNNSMEPFEKLVGDYEKDALIEKIKTLQLNEQNKKDAAKETNLPPNYWKKR